jgi:arginine repressor
MDEAGHPAIVGTIAGDNTIFAATRDSSTAQSLHDELTGYLLQGAA